MTEQENLAYLAGLFDGEGTFSIQVGERKTSRKSKEGKWIYDGNGYFNVNPRMSMTIKYGKEVLERYVEVFGGTIYNYPEQGEYRWFLGKRKEQLIAAKAMLPYLTIKKKIAERYINALEMFPEVRKGTARSEGEKTWTKELTDQIAYIALTLNPPSARKSPKTLEYLEELKKIYEV